MPRELGQTSVHSFAGPQRVGRLVLVALTIAACASLASGQTPEEAEPASESWHGYVTADNLSVRCGRAHEYYEIAQLTEGDIVQVRDVNQFGWATITAPPGLSGFVKALDVEVSADQSSASALGRTPVYYIKDDDPLESWKPARVDSTTDFEILERRETPQGDYFRVLMPPQVPAYVPAEFIRPATEAEIEAWNEAQTTAPEATATGDRRGEAGEGAAPEETNQNLNQPASPLDTAGADQENVSSPPTPIDGPRSPQNEPTGEEADQPVAPGDGDDTLTGDEGAEETTVRDEEPPRLPRLLLEQLEADLDELAEGELLDAEIEPLMIGYREITTDEEATESERRLAEARVAWLELKRDSQRLERRLQESIARATRTPEEIALEAKLADMSALYDVIGRLASSTVYRGGDRPLLYRIEDPVSGRTKAYVRPRPDMELADMLGEIVGVSGVSSRDEDLQLIVVRPQHVQELATVPEN